MLSSLECFEIVACSIEELFLVPLRVGKLPPSFGNCCHEAPSDVAAGAGESKL